MSPWEQDNNKYNKGDGESLLERRCNWNDKFNRNTTSQLLNVNTCSTLMIKCNIVISRYNLDKHG